MRYGIAEMWMVRSWDRWVETPRSSHIDGHHSVIVSADGCVIEYYTGYNISPGELTGEDLESWQRYWQRMR